MKIPNIKNSENFRWGYTPLKDLTKEDLINIIAYLAIEEERKYRERERQWNVLKSFRSI